MFKLMGKKILASLRSTFLLNPYKPSFLLWDIGKQCRPGSDAIERGSDQVFHCLLTEVSYKI